ncbi:MAG: Na/Pi symporter [Candidatus Omnitrophica bacterium]|nr:Na/Pi symporter [Candidatus Omnitrophota bacterium]MCK5393061.1 Na/Pi symporter [Candidatus Omnitrophota bacterium]
MKNKNLEIISKILSVLFFVYLFLLSIGLMGAAFKGFGKGFAETLIASTSNPFIGLFIGILATSIVQSSSTTTSIVIGMVGSGVMGIHNAVPIIMGSNIGTTVTNTLVSLGHVGRREEFKRAVTGGTVHDFFNIMCVCILFPLELSFGLISKLALWMSQLFINVGGIKFTSPIKILTTPIINLIKKMILTLTLPNTLTYILILILSFVFLFLSLYFIVKIMRSLVIEKAEIVLNKVIGKHGLTAILVSLLFTAIVQSSSITIALMIPLVAAGVLTIETMFPLIMGANIGTTTTAILASFATGNIHAVTVAFSHFIFNIIGVCFIYPIKPLRQIPIRLACKLGDLAFKKRRYVIFYVLTLFFVIPVLLIMLSKLLK